MQPTKHLIIDLEGPDESVIDSASKVILQGGLLLCPTDTIYGLSCLALAIESVQRIVEVKGREAGKGLLVLIPDLNCLTRLASELSTETWRLIELLWPGSVTILLPAAPDLPDLLKGAEGKVGVRLPRFRFLECLLAEVGEPLISTSANLSGQAYSGDPVILGRLFAGKIDLFLESSPPLREVPPSTVVDLTRTPPQIVREGGDAQEVRTLLEI